MKNRKIEKLFEHPTNQTNKEGRKGRKEVSK